MKDILVGLENAEDLVIGAEGVAEIVQNVKTILATPVGSVPLDRDFGTSWMLVDQPTTRVQAELSAEIVEKVERYEPRVRVTEVSFVSLPEEAREGRLIPRVRIALREG
ncbi:MAG TPA: hypothetical protein EYP14_09665 [Planctomycetaceae bacterium]|nr:hypothetical protein [Planctomycetaceae bacterium]